MKQEQHQLGAQCQTHSPRGVVDELRNAQRPPGAHITFPEIEWPAHQAAPLDTRPALAGRLAPCGRCWSECQGHNGQPGPEPKRWSLTMVLLAIWAIAWVVFMAMLAGGAA